MSVSGANLSRQYQLQTPSGVGNLSTALWSADGRTVCAAGTYNGADSVLPVLCWDRQGRGARNAFPLSGEYGHGSSRASRRRNRILLRDGVVGVLGRGGAVRWRSAPDLLEYQADPSFPRISPDGDKVETSSDYFDGTKRTRYTIRFSLSDQKLETNIEQQSSLLTPAISGLAVAGWQHDTHPTLDGRALPLDTYEISRSLAIAPTKDSFVLGTDWYLRKFDRQGKQAWSSSVPGTAWGVNISRGWAVRRGQSW